jgi:ATP-binding cassette subfamily F protein 3
MRNISKSFPGMKALDGVSLEVKDGEIHALVGENGAGKTTLTRLIVGDLKPQLGRVKVGQQVEIGYYSQHQIDALDLDKTVMEEVTAFASEAAPQRLRNVLGVF